MAFGRGTVQTLFQTLDDWTIYSILTMGPRCWIPHARCHIGQLMIAGISWQHLSETTPLILPDPHLLLHKCSWKVTPAACYSCDTALCMALWVLTTEKISFNRNQTCQYQSTDVTQIWLSEDSHSTEKWLLPMLPQKRLPYFPCWQNPGIQRLLCWDEQSHEFALIIKLYSNS